MVSGPAEEFFVRFAAMTAQMMTRTAAITSPGEAAASTGRELADYRDRAHTETRANLRALAAELERRCALGPRISDQVAADTVYAMAAHERVFLRLTGECTWSAARYADLITTALAATLGTP